MKKLTWIADSRSNVKSFPAPVQDGIGFTLYVAQLGEMSAVAKPLRGLGGGVMEISAYDASGTIGLGLRHRSSRWNWCGSGLSSCAVR
jgi:phage-related protein